MCDATSPLAPGVRESEGCPELEVLKLVARGSSNAEIASALVVSKATVKTQVTHVLAKLKLRGRVQAVVRAYGSGLV
jgi:DNA-binding NarL/FixJ family response regulator